MGSGQAAFVAPIHYTAKYRKDSMRYEVMVLFRQLQQQCHCIKLSISASTIAHYPIVQELH